MDAAGPDEALDGRTARRDRNRLAVLDAVIALFSLDVEPTPEEVAQRSGLSPRSVYRYFEDRDALVRAAIDRQLELMMPLFLIHGLGDGDRPTRVATLVRARLRLFEAVADASRVARRRATRDPVIRSRVEMTVRALREQVARQFALEIAAAGDERGRVMLASIDTFLQFESLEYLRFGQDLSVGEVEGIVTDTVSRLLD